MSKEYDYDTLDVVDNLLTYPEFCERVKEIAKANDVPLRNVCIAALSGELVVEHRFVISGEDDEDYYDEE